MDFGTCNDFTTTILHILARCLNILNFHAFGNNNITSIGFSFYILFI